MARAVIRDRERFGDRRSFWILAARTPPNCFLFFAPHYGSQRDNLRLLRAINEGFTATRGRFGPAGPGGHMVIDSVRSELDQLPAAFRDSSLAAAAVTLAERLDDAGARDSPPLARELRMTLTELRTAASQAPKGADPVDEIGRARAVRKSKASKRTGGGDKRGQRSGGSGGKRGSASGRASG